MGDLLNNSEIFKKLNFDTSNQWILYDERFQKFVSFIADNITDANILTEHEVLGHTELVQRQQYLDTEERQKKLLLLERNNPGLLNTDADVARLTQEIEAFEQADIEYAELIDDMRATKTHINYGLSALEDNINTLINTEKECLVSCQSTAKKLEELQRENYKLSNEATTCFAKIQSPPLFIHQLPLDQYFIKCDLFMQYFNLYMKENFKIQQDFIDLDNNSSDMLEVASKMKHLEHSIEQYTLAFIKEKAKIRCKQSMIDQLDLTHIHVMSLADIERETHELELVNENHLNTTYETLLNDLGMHVKQRTQQCFELILYENTKQKQERALQRHENDKRLAKMISEALLNAELLWIFIQLDLDKIRNRFDKTEQLNTEAAACIRRIKIMRSLQPSDTSNILLSKMAEQLELHSGQKVRSEPKACLYEYEKFGRLLSYAQQGMLNKKAYAAPLEQLSELNRLESVLRPLVYDSPVVAPMFEHVRFLRSIFNVKMKQQHIEKTLRQLRTQFQENIIDRMTNDKLWRYSQLLWIWFLTEPKRVLMAIEEAKKAAAKVPSLTGVKALGGIKRK